VLTCAWLVAFFPVLANTTLGLHSVAIDRPGPGRRWVDLSRSERGHNGDDGTRKWNQRIRGGGKWVRKLAPRAGLEPATS
jgi:hypothetical protein